MDCTLTALLEPKCGLKRKGSRGSTPSHFRKMAESEFELSTRFFLRVATAFQFKFCSLPAPRGRPTISVAPCELMSKQLQLQHGSVNSLRVVAAADIACMR